MEASWYMSITCLRISILLVSTLLLAPLEAAAAISFEVNDQNYRLEEVDLGSLVGCRPDSVIGVALKHAVTNKTIWLFPKLEDIKQDYVSENGCFASIDQTIILNVWQNPGWVQFGVSRTQCGASCHGSSGDIYKFDGKKVDLIFETFGDNIIFEPPILIKIYAVRGNECMACPVIWAREIYRWNDETYQLKDKEVSDKKSIEPPWDR